MSTSSPPASPALFQAGGENDEPCSPCISVCRMDAKSGLCEGCFRTLDEIACWSGYTWSEKRAVLANVARRRADPVSR